MFLVPDSQTLRPIVALLIVLCAACGSSDAEYESSVSAIGVATLAPEGVADLVIRNGKIATLTEDAPEASALAARSGRIVAVGNDTDVASWIGDETYLIDLAGRLAIPGFIEGHGHFMSLGNSKMILNLTGANTWQEIVEMVAASAREAEPEPHAGLLFTLRVGAAPRERTQIRGGRAQL